MNATPSTVQITSMNGKTYDDTLTASQKDTIQNGTDVIVRMLVIN